MKCRNVTAGRGMKYNDIMLFQKEHDAFGRRGKLGLESRIGAYLCTKQEFFEVKGSMGMKDLFHRPDVPFQNFILNGLFVVSFYP